MIIPRIHRLAYVLAAVAVMLATVEGRAGDAAIHVEGQGATSLRNSITAWAPRGVSVIGQDEWQQAISDREFGKRISQSGSRGKLSSTVLAAAEEVQAAVVILVRVTGKTEAWVLAYATDSGDILADDKIDLVKKSGKKKKKKKRKKARKDLSLLRKLLKPVFAHAKSAPAPSAGGDAAADSDSGDDSGDSNTDWGAPTWASGDKKRESTSDRLLGGGDKSDDDSSDDDDTDSDADNEPSRTTRRSAKGSKATSGALAVAPVYKLIGRKMEYTNRETFNLRPYDALGISLVGFDAMIFPAAFAGDSALADLGLRLHYAVAVGLTSEPTENDQEQITTRFESSGVDLRYRLHFDPALVNVFVGYGKMSFKFTIPAGSPITGTAPQVDYVFVRAGVDGRVALGKIFSILYGAAYRHHLNTGTVGETYFPRSATLAFDGSLGAAVSILDFAEIQIQGEFTRIAYTFNADPLGTYVADSAVDQYMGLGLAFAAFF